MPSAVAGAREENSSKVVRQSTGQGFYPFLKEEPQIWRVSTRCLLVFSWCLIHLGISYQADLVC